MIGSKASRQTKKAGYHENTPLCLLLFNNLHTLHNHIKSRSVVVVGCNVGDLVNHFHALDNLAECRILTVQMRCVGVADEELGGRAVLVCAASHGDYAASVGESVLHTVSCEFTLDSVCRTTHACACGVAALDHKSLDNAVEDEPVVEAFLNKLCEVFHCDGRNLGVKLKLDNAAVFHFDLNHIIHQIPFVDTIYFSLIFYQKNSAKSNIFCEVFAMRGNNIVYIKRERGGRMERRGAWLKLTLCVAAGIIVAFTVRGRIGEILLPLILAYVGATAVRPVAKGISKLGHMNEKIAGAVLSVLICGGGIYGASFVSVRLGEELWRLADDIPQLVERVIELVRRLSEALPLGKTDNGRMMEIFEGILREAAEYMGSSVAKLLGSVVSSFPRLLMGTLVSSVGFIYLASDMDGAAKSIMTLVPERYRERVRSVFLDVSGAVFSYLRAYATIMSVNFIILSVGLTIIGADNPLASGVIIALVDALPLLGCGTVLIPWAVWCFLSGEAVRGVGLLILLGVIYVVRQFLEPRVIGRMTGVHPFVALAAVYIGLKLGGVGGMILAPIILMCVKQYTLGQREEKQT